MQELPGSVKCAWGGLEEWRGGRIMGPISAVNVGSTGGAAGLGSTASTIEPTQAYSSTGTAGLTSSGALGASQAAMRVPSAVAQLLQSIGGGIENDKLLKLLIAALILLALLEQQQEDLASAGKALAQLGARSGDQSQFIGIFSSSTTISIQQTTTTVMFGTGASDALNTDDRGAFPESGGQLNLAI